MRLVRPLVPLFLGLGLAERTLMSIAAWVTKPSPTGHHPPEHYASLFLVPVLAVFLAGVKWLEWLIPKPTRIAAERDYELYREADEHNRDAQRDRILASRMNPYYDAAWRRAERKVKLGDKA